MTSYNCQREICRTIQICLDRDYVYFEITVLYGIVARRLFRAERESPAPGVTLLPVLLPAEAP